MDTIKLKKELFVSFKDTQSRGPDLQDRYKVQQLSHSALINKEKHEFVVAWQQEKKEFTPRQLDLIF